MTVEAADPPSENAASHNLGAAGLPDAFVFSDTAFEDEVTTPTRAVRPDVSVILKVSGITRRYRATVHIEATDAIRALDLGVTRNDREWGRGAHPFGKC